ncbi:hypothetical protein ACX40Y_07410 [Sphingomonas sp. RS6]
MKRRLLLAAVLALGGCGQGRQPSDPPRSPNLEQAAIARGLVSDPAARQITGLFTRDTDRVCIVKQAQAYRIGAVVDYGDGIGCSARGSVSRSGDALRIVLGEDDGCTFAARFDGERIRFPGALPAGCARFCRRRASFTGLQVSRLSESDAEARAMRDPGGRALCQD